MENNKQEYPLEEVIIGTGIYTPHDPEFKKKFEAMLEEDAKNPIPDDFTEADIEWINKIDWSKITPADL